MDQPILFGKHYVLMDHHKSELSRVASVGLVVPFSLRHAGDGIHNQSDQVRAV